MAGLLITGQPRCGKSYWLKKIGVPWYRGQGTRVIVLDPVLGGLPLDVARMQWGGADFVTNNVDWFMEIFKRSDHCAFIVDECGRLCNDYKTRIKIEEIPVTGGNRANLGIFVGQRVMMVPPNIRGMCESAMVFRQQSEDLKDLASLFNEEAIKQAVGFRKGQYLMIKSCGVPILGDLHLPDD